MDKQTFESFIIGDSNIDAYTKCLFCAKNPGELCNPLFIYGDEGVGKTHLLNAIANKYMEDNPNKNTINTNDIDFMDDVFLAKKNNTLEDLKQKYLNADLLIIDNVHSIDNANTARELCNYIIKELIKNNKQVCIASRKKPKEIMFLQDINSLFNEESLIVIYKPDHELALVFIKKRFENNIPDIKVDDDVIEYLAKTRTKGLTFLLGKINRMIFIVKFSLRITHIDLNTAKQLLEID